MNEATGSTRALTGSGCQTSVVENALDLTDDVLEVRSRVRELVAHLDDATFDHQWTRICEADRWVHEFEDDPWTAFEEDAVGNSLAELEKYRTINMADRAGEADYAGIDYEQMGVDLAEAWRRRRRVLIGNLLGEDTA